ncbi:hypothetical protein QUF90_02535 [Desulfococcaceae bacterium HSG9]|nr:hypothetical protein [Desulfococcaceae bacterium HSG9]
MKKNLNGILSIVQKAVNILASFIEWFFPDGVIALHENGYSGQKILNQEYLQEGWMRKGRRGFRIRFPEFTGKAATFCLN